MFHVSGSTLWIKDCRVWTLEMFGQVAMDYGTQEEMILEREEVEFGWVESVLQVYDIKGMDHQKGY